MQPGNSEVAKAYSEGPTKTVSQQCMEGTASIAGDADPIIVADVLVQLAAIPRGQKPYRMSADPAEDGSREAAAVIDRFGVDFLRRMGLLEITKVSL